MNDPARTMRLPRLARTVVARPRLETRLGLPTPLTVVSGPVGAGKTTLVAHWCERLRGDEPEAHRWVSLDPRTSPTSLWTVLTRAIDDLAPRPAGSDDPWKQLVASVEGLTRPVRVVVDGLDRLVGDEPHGELVELVRRSRWLRLIVCARGTQILRAADAAGLEVTSIGTPELRLDEDEHARLLAAHGLELSTEQEARLHEALGGWPALVHVAAASVAERSDLAAVEHEGRAAAERYLRDHVLPELLDEEERRVASRLAVLDVIEPDVAAIATGLDDPSPLLAELEDAGILYAPPHAGAGGVSFPEVTRSVLQRQLWRDGEGAARRLHRELAARFAERGDAVAAVQHAQHGADWTTLVELLSEHFVTLLVNHDAVLRDALKALPPDVLESRPTLRDAQAVLRGVPVRGGIAGAALPPDPNVLLADADDDELRERLSRAFIHAAALRMGGRSEASVDMATRIRALYDELDDARRHAVVDYAPVLLAQLGITRLLGADLGGAETDFLRCYAEATATGDELFAFDAATYEALTRALIGDTGGATTWLARSAEHDFEPPAPWLAEVLGTSGDLAAALVALDRLDRGAADAALSELGDATGPDELWALMAHVRTRYALLWGDPTAQLVDVGRARAAHPGRAEPGSLADVVLTADTVDLLAAAGQAHRARRTLEQAATIHPRLGVARARLALLTGRPDEAAVVAAAGVWGEDTAERERLDLLVLLALAEDARGDDAAARRAAARAITAARTTGNLAALLMVPAGGVRRLAALVDDTASFDHPGLAGAVEAFPASLERIELSEREQVVLEHLAVGTSLESIARTLYVSINTVKTQARGIYRKLGASSRHEAVVRALELGLLEGRLHRASGTE